MNASLDAGCGCTLRHPSGAHCLARLYLRAVLPALATYVARDESARRAADGRPFVVRFASTSGVATTISVGDGAVRIDPPAAGLALRLLFLSDRALVRAFRRDGAPLALPWGGLHHLVRVRTLMDLLAGMEGVLNTPAEECSRDGRRELRVALLLGEVIPAAVAELGEHDEECRRLLAPFGDFVARLSVAQVSEGWIRRRGARMQWGRGPAPVPPDVQIEFRDPAVAQSALDGLVDRLAATVGGEISVRGMIPLADALGLVMEKVSECLGPGPT